MKAIHAQLACALILSSVFGTAQGQRQPTTELPQHEVKLNGAPHPDPLDASTARCDFHADPAEHVKLDASQVAASRRLKRKAYPDTDIKALRPGSPHWTTGCPVTLGRGTQGSSVCTPINVFEPASGESVLRIAQAGNQLVFKIDNTARGTIRGTLNRTANPHGGQEEVWLSSSQVTRNGAPETFNYYVFMQEKDGLKYYLVEAFDPADSSCIAEHLPSAATLCRNVASSNGTCVRRTTGPRQTASVSAAVASARKPADAGAASRSSAEAGPISNDKKPVDRSSGDRNEKGKSRRKQTDTGGGHEPPPVDN